MIDPRCKVGYTEEELEGKPTPRAHQWSWGDTAVAIWVLGAILTWYPTFCALRKDSPPRTVAAMMLLVLMTTVLSAFGWPIVLFAFLVMWLESIPLQ